jgi:hypothetical protein
VEVVTLDDLKEMSSNTDDDWTEEDMSSPRTNTTLHRNKGQSDNKTGGSIGVSLLSLSKTSQVAKSADSNNNELSTLIAGKQKTKQKSSVTRAGKFPWSMMTRKTSNPVELQPNKGPLTGFVHTANVYDYDSEEDFSPSQPSPSKGAPLNHRAPQGRGRSRKRSCPDRGSPSSPTKTRKQKKISNLFGSSTIGSASHSASTNCQASTNNSLTSTPGRCNSSYRQFQMSF